MAISQADLEARLRPSLAEQSVARCRRQYSRWDVVFARVGIEDAEQLDGDARDLLDLLVLNARPREERRSRHNRRVEHDLRDSVAAKFPALFEQGRSYKGL